MKTIGLIGGMSWESSLRYYQLINQATQARLGGLHAARSLMYTLDFAELEGLQRMGQWDAAADLLVDAAQRLARGGAECIIICANTMHKVAGAIRAAVDLPLLHIADATGERIRAAGLGTVGLLGTRFTMEEPFYCEHLRTRYDLRVLIPPPAERDLVHDVIYQELCRGVLNPESRRGYRAVMAGLVAAGAQGIILGCTEIGMLVSAEDATIPLFDTTTIHAEAAVAWALA